MAFSINQFKRQLELGGARPSLFEVTVTFPTLGSGGGNGVDGGSFSALNAQDKIRFMCKTTSIPQSVVAPIEVPYFGRKVKVAGSRTFEPWTITVINDEDFVVRRAFEHWLASINGHETNLKNNGVFSNPATYQGTATVNQYGKSTEFPIRTYEFVNVFPSEVSPIELGWATDGEIEEFSVTLQYDYWQISNTGDNGTPV